MRAQPRSLEEEINVTPFLDVLLVLLVMFMIALQSTRKMEVVLPEPSRSSCEVGCESIVLEVLLNREYALNRTRFDAPQLSARLRSAFAGRPMSILFVKADPRVRYQEVVWAMDAAKGAGVRVLAIDPEASPALRR